MNPIPQHVAIVMDGNGRWAQSRGMSRMVGHREGVEVVDRIVTAAREAGVRYLTLYAFSDENWSRPAEEVAGLMDLLAEFPKAKQPKMIANGIRFRTIGEIDHLPATVQSSLAAVQQATAAGAMMTLILAVSYGSHNEICRAVRRCLADRIAAITPEAIHARLDTAEFPDPDLFIRTSGEWRVSNFLLWQLAYAELYFTETLWPEFSPAEFQTAIDAYRRRERRFGRSVEQGPELVAWRVR